MPDPGRLKYTHHPSRTARYSLCNYRMIHYKANSTKYILFATGFWHNTGDGINFPFLLSALTCFWPSVALRTFDTNHFFMTVHFGNIQPGLIIITIAKLGKKCRATGKRCWAIAAIYARWSFRWFHKFLSAISAYGTELMSSSKSNLLVLVQFLCGALFKIGRK